MVWTSGWKLASAVSENGCLGLIGAGSMKPELLREHIQKLRNYFSEKNIDKPFGINVPLMRGDVKELLRVTFEENIKIIFTSAGSPKVFAGEIKSRGIKLVHVAASVAEGFEAGGHNGIDEITTLCLIPQVVDALEIPVIAAGGIADGRQIAACFALGAEGVQIGTRFAATIESSSSDIFKNKIVEAKDNSTILTLKKLAPVRLLKNEFGLKADALEKSGASAEELRELLGKKREMMGIFEGNTEEGELEMGQSSGLVKEIKSVKEVIEILLMQYRKTISYLHH
jgi:enoyl-[acyl-carrier protein] reductase II